MSCSSFSIIGGADFCSDKVGNGLDNWLVLFFSGIFFDLSTLFLDFRAFRAFEWCTRLLQRDAVTPADGIFKISDLFFVKNDQRRVYIAQPVWE